MESAFFVSGVVLLLRGRVGKIVAVILNFEFIKCIFVKILFL